MTEAFRIASPHVENTQALARALALECKQGDCIALSGELGAGKTTFARGFIHALQDSLEEVVSPTFTLVQQYAGRQGISIWHFDLYRLKSEMDLKEIGLEDALQTGITLIEWPDLAAAFLPSRTLHVNIDCEAAMQKRHFSFQGNGWTSRLAGLKEQFYTWAA